MPRHCATGSGRDGISPSSSCAPDPRRKTPAGIKIQMGHCQISQPYSGISACLRAAVQDFAGCVVPRLPAGFGVGEVLPWNWLGIFIHGHPSRSPGTWQHSFGISSSLVEVWGVPTSPSQQDSSDLALPSGKGAITHRSGHTVAAALRELTSLPQIGVSLGHFIPLGWGGQGWDPPYPAAHTQPVLGQRRLLLIAASASLIFICCCSCSPSSPRPSPSWRGEVPAAGEGRFLLPLQRSRWIPQKPSP